MVIMTNSRRWLWAVAWIWTVPVACTSSKPVPEVPRAEIETSTAGEPIDERPSKDDEPAPAASTEGGGPDCETPYQEAKAECREQLAEAEASCDQAGDQCDRRLIPTLADCVGQSGAEELYWACRCEGRGEEEACKRLGDL